MRVANKALLRMHLACRLESARPGRLTRVEYIRRSAIQQRQHRGALSVGVVGLFVVVLLCNQV